MCTARFWLYGLSRAGNELKMRREFPVWPDDFSKQDLRHPFYTFNHVISSSSKCSKMFYLTVQKKCVTESQTVNLFFSNYIFTFNSQYCLCQIFKPFLSTRSLAMELHKRLINKWAGLHISGDYIYIYICEKHYQKRCFFPTQACKVDQIWFIVVLLGRSFISSVAWRLSFYHPEQIF